MCFGAFANLKLSTKTSFTSRSMEYIGNNLQLFSGTERHRYKNCPVLQRIMPKMRNEGLSEADRKTLNSKVIDGNNVNMPRRRIPASLRSIMPNDAASISMCSDRISRNTTLSAHPITYRKCDCHKVLSFEHMKVFFEKCSEAVVTSSRSKHLDPILCHLVSASSSMVVVSLLWYSTFVDPT
jgi:hypothetical protein